jgi:hypothetical protein
MITNTTIHKHLDVLLQKYQDNEYMTARLSNYMEHLLPTALETEYTTHLQREERKKNLSTNRDEFINRFLCKNNYYYSSQTELFLNYNGVHFVIYSEDDIHHQILSTITSEQDLMPWKQKIKINILKQIREKSPLNAIPESATIQYVIDALHPAIFSTKNHAKYFLTILGDCILDKKPPINSQTIIYIAPSSCKEILREIGNQCYTFFGLSNIFNTIKYKYYDHDYQSCRLIPMNKNGMPIPQQLYKNMLDFLCVSAHYSSRYGSADHFLEHCSESALIDHALFLSKNTPSKIVDTFSDKSIKHCPGSKISNKNMIFLWKKFLKEKDLPNIIFYDNLKTLFKKKWTFNEEEDCFLDATSMYLPMVATFNKFWDTTISEDGNGDYDLEVDELSSLFRKWHTRSTSASTSISVSNSMTISDSMLIELIHHFHPDITIEDDKYILHIKCNLWDKRKEIIDSLELFKLKVKSDETVEHITKSLYEAYEFYLTDNKGKNKNVASKRYFEKVAVELIHTHIDNDGLISPTWWK